MSHRALFLATLGEAGFLVLGALVWAAGAASTLLPWIPVALTTWQVLLTECVGLAVGYACLQWWRRHSANAQVWIPLFRPAWLLLPLPLELLLFGAMCLSLVFPAHVLLRTSGDLWLLPAAAGASWMAGFLVIGAPAGLGVREAVFLALLHGHMPESDILLLAAAFRVITFGGDVLLLLLGLVLRRFVDLREE